MITSIVLDATHFASPEPTGVEEYVYALLPLLSQLLLKAGVAVSWIGHIEQPALEMPEKVQWIYSPHSSFWSQRALPAFLQKIRPDLYFTPSGIPPLRYTGKTASTIHDLGIYRFPDSYTVAQLVQLRYVAKRAASHSSVLLTPSSFCKNEIVARWKVIPDVITVTPLAYTKKHLTEEPLSYVSSDQFLAYIGRIEAKKNLLPVLEGFAKMSSQIVTQLVLAGKDGYGARDIYKAIAKLPTHIRSRIITPGYVSNGQKQWLFEHAAAMIVPGQAEGFGIPVLEAFSFQVPVLCAQAGSLPEVAGDAAVFVQADIATDWALQMASILTDRQLRDHLITRGTNRLKKFDWQTTAELSAQALLST